jgi:hypothetical protein
MADRVPPKADVRSAIRQIETVAKWILSVGGAAAFVLMMLREIVTFVRGVADKPVPPLTWGGLLDKLGLLGLFMFTAGMAWIVLGRFRDLESRIAAKVNGLLADFEKKQDETLATFKLRMQNDVLWTVDEILAKRERERAAKREGHE